MRKLLNKLIRQAPALDRDAIRREAFRECEQIANFWARYHYGQANRETDKRQAALQIAKSMVSAKIARQIGIHSRRTT